MRIRTSLLVSALCVAAISSPAWAKDLSTRFQFVQPTEIVGTHLKAGTYRFVANESTGQVNILRNGKIVAQVKGQWIDIKDKSPYNEVMSTHNDIQEVRFEGKSRALKFSS